MRRLLFLLLILVGSISICGLLPGNTQGQSSLCQGVRPFFEVLPRTKAPSYAFCYSGIPDLEQKRHIGPNVLPSDGQQYCAPTTAIDWILHLYKTGFTRIIPPPPATGLYEYKYDTERINDMGSSAYMRTNALAGTQDLQIRTGILNWLKYYLKSDPFDVNILQGSKKSAPPLLEDMAKTIVDSRERVAILATIGWYSPNEDSDSPKTVYRDGGHEVLLTGAWLNLQKSRKVYIGVNDPSSHQNATVPESPSAMEYHLVKDAQVAVATCPNEGPCPGSPARLQTMTNVVAYGGGNGYFDGAIEILPKEIESYSKNELLSASAWTTPFEIRQPVCNCMIRTLTLASLSRDVDYLVDGSDSIFRWDPVSKESKVIASIPGVMRLAAGGYDDSLYAVTANETMQLNHSGEILNIVTSAPADAVAFDEYHQKLIALSRGRRTITKFSSDLHEAEIVHLQQDVCGEEYSSNAAVRLSVSETSGDVWARCDGSSSVTKLSPDGTVRPVILVDAPHSFGLFVDGIGHIFVSVDNRLAEFDGNGRKVEDPYLTGISVGEDLQFSRSVSNTDLSKLTFPGYREVSPSQNLSRVLKSLAPQER